MIKEKNKDEITKIDVKCSECGRTDCDYFEYVEDYDPEDNWVFCCVDDRDVERGKECPKCQDLMY